MTTKMLVATTKKKTERNCKAISANSLWRLFFIAIPEIVVITSVMAEVLLENRES